jgi:[ribosomal protein S5]-alanine N-acetyltransferase
MPTPENVRLVRVNEDGSPAEAQLDLPPVARETLAATAANYRNSGFAIPWIGYLAVRGDECVGGCAFKSPPVGNRVEIAYFTFPAFEGRGFATQMARALIEVACLAESGVLITARTLPEEGASTKILRNLNFKLIGTVEDPEDGAVWEWHLKSSP